MTWNPSLLLKYVNGRLWEVEHAFAYKPPVGDIVVVPGRFVTDFASIPRFFWRILPPVGDGDGAGYGPAAVVHDYLYKYPEGRSRGEVDRVFYDAMVDLGVSAWRRRLIHLAVRAFGWIPWRNYRKWDDYKSNC